jgi:hypothetical protein
MIDVLHASRELLASDHSRTPAADRSQPSARTHGNRTAIVYVRRRVQEFTAAATNHPTSAATAIIAKYGTTTPTMCLWFAANHVLASRLTTITALTPATTLDRAVGATRASRKRKASVDEYRANAAIPVALRRANSSRK